MGSVGKCAWVVQDTFRIDNMVCQVMVFVGNYTIRFTASTHNKH